MHGFFHLARCACRLCAGALRLPRRHDIPADDPADARLPGGDPGAAADRELHPAGPVRHPARRRLVHTALALPFAVLVSASLFLAIPRELEEAAWVFGCTGLAAFLRVVLPLALPGIAATAIFAFVISWNEVFAATVLTVRQQDADGLLADACWLRAPLHVQFRGRVHADHSVRSVHLPRAPLSVRHVGDSATDEPDGPLRWRRSHRWRVARPSARTAALETSSCDIARWRVPGAAGPVGLRQDHAAAHHRRAGAQSAGRVLIGGRDVSDLPPRKRGLAMVFQNYAVFPHMTVRDKSPSGCACRGADEIGSSAR